jgi:hypothetical protein
MGLVTYIFLFFAEIQNLKFVSYYSWASISITMHGQSDTVHLDKLGALGQRTFSCIKSGIKSVNFPGALTPVVQKLASAIHVPQEPGYHSLFSHGLRAGRPGFDSRHE